MNQRKYSAFELQTERELAHIFRRYPRSEPRPYEVPYYPFVHQNPYTRSRWPYHVSFNLGYNVWAI